MTEVNRSSRPQRSEDANTSHRGNAAKRRRLERILHMGAGELAGRSRQKLRQWLERVPGRTPIDVADADVSRACAAIRALPADRARFVKGAMPGEEHRLAAAARELMAGRVRLLGHDLSLAAPIDWQRGAPLVHWSRIDPLDAAAVGDAKLTWELGRHQWLVTLAQAYALERDDRLAERALAHLDDWIAQNPVGVGIHWTSSLECALRVIAWSWILSLLRGSPALTDERLARLVRALAAHADHVDRYLSTYFSPNTHLTGEALGLVYAGELLAPLAAAARWRRRGNDILARELYRQVSEDGVHFEQSTCYHRYTVDIYLHWLVRERPADRALGEQLQRMIDYLLWLRRPDGTLPAIGDADGGTLLPLSARAPDDARAVFSTAAVVFRRADYAWAAGGLAPETVWLLGPEAAGELASLRAAPPAAPPSRLFASSCAIVRESWASDADQLVLDVGPLGCPVSSGHGHADLLAVQASFGGEPLLVDPGTFSYADEPWRSAFRSSLAHTTLAIDGRSQAEPAGPFAWRQRPSAHLERWWSRRAFEQITASHAAYGLVHRRSVIVARPRRYLIVDRVEGHGEHELELHFQLAPGARVESWRGALRVTGAHGRAFDLRVIAPAPVALAVHEGWYSPDYGVRVPAPHVTATVVARLPVTLTTLLVPCVESPAS
ncbi:MAG: heparinase II/III family protein [Acidobacteriota bacterium]